MVRKRDVNLISDIIRLQVLEHLEKKEIVDRLSDKYSVNEATIYRNISEVDSYIQDRVKILKMLSTTSLNQEEFKEKYDQVKQALS